MINHVFMPIIFKRSCTYNTVRLASTNCISHLHRGNNRLASYYFVCGGFVFIKVICHQCGIEFEKVDKEIRRQQREGRDYFFCGRSCTAIYANKIRHNTPNDGLKPYQRRTKKIEALLGDKLSSAKSRLNKLLMFELAKKCNIVQLLAAVLNARSPAW